LRGDGGVDPSSAILVSSEPSCTAGSKPDELSDSNAMERSEREMEITSMDLSDVIAKEGALPAWRSGVGGGELRRRRPRPSGCKARSKAGSELEWPTKICPERRDAEPRDMLDEVCEDLPRERWEALFLPHSFRSFLQSGHEDAFTNHMSMHLAWKMCVQSRTLQMSTPI